MMLRLILILALMQYYNLVEAIEMSELRKKNNVTCLLVFGDSSVDPGNNNYFATSNRGNYLPYGKDFFNSQPTGRFCNGRLATDFIAEGFGRINMIRGFLDPRINTTDLLHGISFASAGSGYDDLTANLSSVLTLSKQREYLRHYEIHLRQMVGAEKATETMHNAIYVLSMGTNDFLQNYFVEPERSQQYSVEQYQNLLISSLVTHVKEIHSLGARKLAVVGVPPFGCAPIIRTLRDEINCDADLNKVAFSFNSKIQKELQNLKRLYGIKASFVDIYSIIQDAIKSPNKFGFMETRKGCCGTGTTEYGLTCKGLSTCADRTKYVFWDAVHLTEKMYKIIADEALKSISSDLLT